MDRIARHITILQKWAAKFAKCIFEEIENGIGVIIIKILKIKRRGKK